MNSLYKFVLTGSLCLLVNVLAGVAFSQSGARMLPITSGQLRTPVAVEQENVSSHINHAARSRWSTTQFEGAVSRLGVDHFLSLRTGIEVEKGVQMGVAGFLRTNLHQIASWSALDQQDYGWMTYGFVRGEFGRIKVTERFSCTCEAMAGCGLVDKTSRFCQDVRTTNGAAMAELAMLLRYDFSSYVTAATSLSCFYSPTFEYREVIDVPRPTVSFSLRVNPWH